MSWLKPNEWMNWDERNLRKQEAIAEENVKCILLRLHDWLNLKQYAALNNRLSKWKNSPTVSIEKATTKNIFELQRDVSALEFFISQGYMDKVNMLDFDLEKGLYLQIQVIMHWNPTIDLQPTFPQMVHDSIKAIETDGHEPPAHDMQKARDYFAHLAQNAIE